MNTVTARPPTTVEMLPDGVPLPGSHVVAADAIAAIGRVPLRHVRRVFIALEILTRHYGPEYALLLTSLGSLPTETPNIHHDDDGGRDRMLDLPVAKRRRVIGVDMLRTDVVLDPRLAELVALLDSN